MIFSGLALLIQSSSPVSHNILTDPKTWLPSWFTEWTRKVQMLIPSRLNRLLRLRFLSFWWTERKCAVSAFFEWQFQCFFVSEWVLVFCSAFKWLSLCLECCSSWLILCDWCCSRQGSQDFRRSWGLRGFRQSGQWFGWRGQLRLNQGTRGWGFVVLCFSFDFFRRVQAQLWTFHQNNVFLLFHKRVWQVRV